MKDITNTLKIRLHPVGKEILVREGTSLMDVLHEYGIEFPCGGKGKCSACRVKILEGDIKLSEKHAERLKAFDLSEEWRLACMSVCEQDVTIEVQQFETAILADNTPFEFTPGEGYGIAVDLGSTTLVAQLLNLKSGEVTDVTTNLNPQSKYGADIISRIEYALKSPEHLHTLRDIIRRRLWEMIEKMLINISAGEVRKVVLVGNTVMQHLFCGFDVQPLSYFPFESPLMGLKIFSPGELDWPLPAQAEICFMPSIGSFVGSDILAGIFATRIHEQDQLTGLIDLGTNGEVVLGNREKIFCASTAAGPAFEGARIRMGMTATTGAISTVEMHGEGFACKVIGNERPRGICGSGLIDALALSLNNGFIDDFGQIKDNLDKILLLDPVYLYQQDIREVQLAKAAVATGMEILAKRHGITLNKIDHLYIAGAFGNYLNIPNTIRLGLLEVEEDKILKRGNTALTGAKMFLFAGPEQLTNLLQITSHVNLEAFPGFQDMFIQKMTFNI